MCEPFCRVTEYPNTSRDLTNSLPLTFLGYKLMYRLQANSVLHGFPKILLSLEQLEAIRVELKGKLLNSV